MVAFRFLLTFMVIFLFAEHTLAFETIIEGKEYKFKYNFNKSSTVDLGWKRTDSYQELKCNLTIKALPGKILECQMSEVEGTGMDYLDELKEIFTVKVDGGKVLEVNNTGNRTEDGNHKKKEMIEHIIKDRSDIVRAIKKGKRRSSIEMPIVGQCKSQLKEKMEKDKKLYRALSTIKNCVIEDEVLAELQQMGNGDILENGLADIQLIYDRVSNKQIGLFMFVEIQNRLNQTIGIDYLGSDDIAPSEMTNVDFI